MSQEAVERRRGIVGFIVGAALVVAGIRHISTLVGIQSKILAGVGWSVATGVITQGERPFAVGARAGAAVAGATHLFYSAYQLQPAPGEVGFSRTLQMMWSSFRGRLTANPTNFSTGSQSVIWSIGPQVYSF